MVQLTGDGPGVGISPLGAGQLIPIAAEHPHSHVKERWSRASLKYFPKTPIRQLRSCNMPIILAVNGVVETYPVKPVVHGMAVPNT